MSGRHAEDDPRVPVVANAVGWELHSHDRNRTPLGDGQTEVVEVSGAQAEAARRVARRVIADLDEWESG